MSAIYSFENYVDQILKLAKPILDGQEASVEASLQAEEDFVRSLRTALDEGMWSNSKQQTLDPKGNVYMYPWSNTVMFQNTHSEGGKEWIYHKHLEKAS